VIITGIICLLFYSNIANKEIFTLISEYVSKNLELTLSLYENMGMKQESIFSIYNIWFLYFCIHTCVIFLLLDGCKKQIIPCSVFAGLYKRNHEKKRLS
jgi:hypothetical protein